MKGTEKEKGLSRRAWLSAAFAGAGLVVVRPARSAAAPVAMRVAEHWHPGEEKK